MPMFQCLQSICSLKKVEFEATDVLFNEHLQFQHDIDDTKVKTFVDNDKSKEVDKRSDRYLLLKIVERSVDNFTKLAKKIPESSYRRIFQGVIDLALYDTDIEVDDGKLVSEPTRIMSILNDYDSTEIGRRIDVLTLY